MLTNWDVYVAFRQAQAEFMNRPYRLPKDWDSFLAKMNEKNRHELDVITISFNTRWKDIDIKQYFLCGFELYGSRFSYNKFFDRKIILLYRQKDKIIKSRKDKSLAAFERSKAFVREWMSGRKCREDISLFKQYCMLYDDGLRAPITHYRQNKIDIYFMTWLMGCKNIVLSDEERLLVPLVSQKYWKNWQELANIMKGAKNDS